jgi:mRNA interferase HigB
VNVINRRTLVRFGEEYPAAKNALFGWYRLTKSAKWHSFQQVRDAVPTVDQVGKVLIFNIVGGDYRLIVRVSYNSQRLYVKALMKHKEYDRKEWMKWA